MSRSDLKEIGQHLQSSTAAVVVIARSKLQEVLAGAIKHASRQVEKELSTEVEAFDKAMSAAIDQFLKAA